MRPTRLVQDRDGARHWVVSSDCPVEMRSGFEQMEATGRDRPRGGS